jgi:CO dehydrogenase/acetyl-CoA synthase gamma subunit (corrinoid Fe-S protein)
MALTGLEIYKLLPQTNCKECSFPTCLAFAMKLAAKQAELKACPYVSEESKARLEAASSPPIRLVELVSEDGKVAVGNETVLFRHEKTFYHRPGLFLRLKDSLPGGDQDANRGGRCLQGRLRRHPADARRLRHRSRLRRSGRVRRGGEGRARGEQEAADPAGLRS